MFSLKLEAESWKKLRIAVQYRSLPPPGEGGSVADG